MFPKQIERLPWRRIDDRAVVVNPRRAQVHELDEVGTFLWEAASGRASLDAIAETVADAFEVDPSVARADAQEFYASLEALGLIVLSAEASPCPS